MMFVRANTSGGQSSSSSLISNPAPASQTEAKVGAGALIMVETSQISAIHDAKECARPYGLAGSGGSVANNKGGYATPVTADSMSATTSSGWDTIAT